MKKIAISDITLREFVPTRDSALTFKEKLEIARTLDRLGVDVIELPVIRDRKADKLTNKTIAAGVSDACVCATAGLSTDAIDDAWDSVRGAVRPALNIMVPVSPIQMEYTCGKKPAAMLDMIKELVSHCRSHCEDVQLTALDATRAEESFLYSALGAAIEAGANKITVCDSDGAATPGEIAAFIERLRSNVFGIKNARLSVQLSDSLRMGLACCVAAIDAGAVEIKTTVSKMGYPRLEFIERFFQVKGAALGIETGIKTVDLNRSVKQLQWILQTNRGELSAFDNPVTPAANDDANITLDINDDVSVVARASRQLGYELSEEDNARVYDAVQRVVRKKQFVGARELEAIIASSAMQVPSVYHIVSYVITSGNTLTAMANITLEKDGKKLHGLANGDGPVDASFLAVEQIVGHHYELDDFQIQAVTEGREAMGSALIKLRSGGKLYSGAGISTDIIGACIRAYINALNKIVYEEG